jgi:hypothetical protein
MLTLEKILWREKERKPQEEGQKANSDDKEKEFHLNTHL